MKLLIFLLGFPIALLMMIYRERIVNFTGKMTWAEQYLGSGGTYNLVIIVAVVVWLGCMMYALGSFDQIFGLFAFLFGKS